MSTSKRHQTAQKRVLTWEPQNTINAL